MGKIYVDIDPEHARRNITIGMVLAVDAVDWGLVDEQVARNHKALTIVRGRIYGEIIVCNGEWVTLAPQVFEDGGVRNALSLPWATIERVEVLSCPE